MTRISYTDPSGENADYQLSISGYANPEACAALSALWHAFTMGIERLAILHPDDIKIYEPLPVAPRPMLSLRERTIQINAQSASDELRLKYSLDRTITDLRVGIIGNLNPDQRAAYEAGMGIWNVRSEKNDDGGVSVVVSLNFRSERVKDAETITPLLDPS